MRKTAAHHAANAILNHFIVDPTPQDQTPSAMALQLGLSARARMSLAVPPTPQFKVLTQPVGCLAPQSSIDPPTAIRTIVGQFADTPKNCELRRSGSLLRVAHLTAKNCRQYASGEPSGLLSCSHGANARRPARSKSSSEPEASPPVANVSGRELCPDWQGSRLRHCGRRLDRPLLADNPSGDFLAGLPSAAMDLWCRALRLLSWC